MKFFAAFLSAFALAGADRSVPRIGGETSARRQDRRSAPASQGGPARWDFAQLVDWFDYLLPRVAAAGLPITADKDESLNRVRFSVVSIEQRDKVVAALAALPVPCDLVVVDLNGLIVRF